MAAQLDPGGEDTFAAINVTPLVDIMLVLLVVFMVTARLINQSSVPMDLPRASTGHARETIHTISITRAGEVSLDGELVSNDTLRSRIHTALVQTPDLRAVIAASRDARHGRVVETMDALRQGGLTRIAFGVSPEDAP